MKKRYIQPSKSPQTAPVFFIGKKDEKMMMVQDFILFSIFLSIFILLLFRIRV